jgi:hypothetical protein
VAAVLLLGNWKTSGGNRAFAAEGKPNACGCFRDSVGACSCSKKAKCGCPGDCEPKGCEEKRSKQLEKEIEVETRKATSGAGGGNKHAASTAATGRSGASEPGDDNDSDAENSGAKRKTKGPHLTAKQKKELRKLLDVYLSEHPDQAGQSVDQLRNSVAPE